MFLRAPQDKVWHAISDASEFGNWFGMEFDGEFAPGAQMSGRIKATKADASVAEMQKKYAGTPVADGIHLRSIPTSTTRKSR